MAYNKSYPTIEKAIKLGDEKTFVE